MNKQYGFYIDTTRCTGCKTCQVACKDENNLHIGQSYRRVYEYTGGEWHKGENDTWEQNVFAYYVSISCNHCDEPACTAACPSGAMHKREKDGLVHVDQTVCVGCRYCEMACPYGAPQFDPVKKVMAKCDGCYDRLEQGLDPICVGSCPLRAIKFGEIDELRTKYGSNAFVDPLPDPKLTKPNLIVKSNERFKKNSIFNSRVNNLEEY